MLVQYTMPVTAVPVYLASEKLEKINSFPTPTYVQAQISRS